MINTAIRVDDELVQRTLDRAVRTGINANVKTGLRIAAERIALPRAKVMAPSVVDQYLTAASTIRGAYITTKGPKVYDRIAGLLEYGGSVDSDIHPTKKQAIRIGDTGEVRAVAYRGPFKGKPARFTGQDRIKRGVQLAMPQMVSEATEEILRAFR
jgi:hypothetical protein